jgi:hypothetical protein
MPKRIIRSILISFALPLVSVTFAVAQSSTSVEIPVTPARNNWQIAQSVGSSKGNILVVTLDKPDRQQACRVQSFTEDKLVCSRAIGAPRTYLPQQILALLLPSDNDLKYGFVLGLNVLLGAAIWGTVVLAPMCPGCAVATGVVALVLFGAAGALLIADDTPNSLLYLAPGKQLSKKLGHVQY